jgi:acyl-coenzyme A thioesterase PaaI-like protein
MFWRTTMNPAIPIDHRQFNSIRAGSHPRCVVCSPANPMGMGLEFTPQPDGSVKGVFSCGELFEGYPDLLHGGIVAALLDGAMTNCLFARNLQALTAELRIRYRHPVSVQSSLTIRARLISARPPLHQLEAELIQDGTVKAWAAAKFMGQPNGFYRGGKR